MVASRAKLKIAIADDDETIRALLEYHAARRGFEALIAGSGREFQTIVSSDTDVALLDLRMPDGDGFECLAYLREKHPDIPAVILSAADEIDDAVEAMKAGAVDYLSKPFDLDELFLCLQKAVELSQLRRENRALRESVHTSRPINGIIGESDGTAKLIKQIERISSLDSTVMLRGESGVGKGLIARTIHYSSKRSEEPFVTVSCPALPRDLLESELFGHEKGAFTGAHQRRIGKIEMAAGGTLFLDEIGDLPLDLQPKLLNVLQDREFFRVGGNEPIPTDIRVVAATHVDLDDQVQRRQFREDLYYRLNVIPLEVPALRDRLEDIASLTQFFLGRISEQRGLDRAIQVDPEAMKLLQRFDWPGNIRQLENVLERSSAFCEDNVIREADLPNDIVGDSGVEESGSRISIANIPLAELEREALLQTLRASNGNKAETARRLGITEKSVYNKLRRFNAI
ncbi:MAG: sigma-54 dependent transcriptional regulator [Verrucomicrobiota bacterium]